MMFNSKRWIFSTLLVLASFLTVQTPVLAQSVLVPGCAQNQSAPITRQNPPNADGSPNTTTIVPPPSLNCVLQVGINISKIVLGLAGAMSLLVFVVGGFLMLISGMNNKYYDQGKTYLVNAFIGLLIIFSAGIIVRYFISTLNVNQRNYPIIGQTCNGGGVFIQNPDGSVTCTSANK